MPSQPKWQSVLFTALAIIGATLAVLGHFGYLAGMWGRIVGEEKWTRLLASTFVLFCGWLAIRYALYRSGLREPRNRTGFPASPGPPTSAAGTRLPTFVEAAPDIVRSPPAIVDRPDAGRPGKPSGRTLPATKDD